MFGRGGRLCESSGAVPALRPSPAGGWPPSSDPCYGRQAGCCEAVGMTTSRGCTGSLGVSTDGGPLPSARQPCTGLGREGEKDSTGLPQGQDGSGVRVL